MKAKTFIILVIFSVLSIAWINPKADKIKAVREWSTAVEKGDDYYLYVVTNLQQRESQIHIIHNPYKELHEPHKEERILYEIKNWKKAFKNIQVVELE